MAFSRPIEARSRDVDPLGHIDHAAVVTHLEAARPDPRSPRSWLEGQG